MRPKVLPIGSVLLDRHRVPRPAQRPPCLVRVGPWHEKSSRGTAGRNRSDQGEQVGLHLSSSAGRPVRVEVARVGARREVVFSSDAVAGRRARDAARRRLEGVRVARGADAGRRAGLALGLLRGRHGDRRRREGAARLRVLRRPSAPRDAPGARAHDQYVARLQRLRRAEPVHRRDPRRDAAPDGGRLPVQAAGQGSSRHRDRRARPAECRARRLHPDQPPLGLRRVGRVARLGAAVPAMGRTRGLRDRRVHQRRSGGAPRGAAGRGPVPLRRARRVLVTRHARHGGGVHRRRRERGVLLGQHVVVAGADGGGRPRRHGRATRPSSRAIRCWGRISSRR